MLDKIVNTSSSSYNKEFNVYDVEMFFNNINYEKSIKSNSCLYVDFKSLSQDKLRSAGFTITRSKDKADYIIIEDKDSLIGNAYTRGGNYIVQNYGRHAHGIRVETFFDNMYSEQSKGYKYVSCKDIYKHLYKYTGNLELFNNCNELLKSGNHDNVKMAMEFMSNADWGGNEIYLKEIFSTYWYGNGYIRNNDFKNSISFKGFLSSLSFDYEQHHYYDGAGYKEDCVTQEHHDFVYNKFIDKFKEQLEYLIKANKIKIDKLEYSIEY